MPETGDDARDDLSVSMLTNQHRAAGASIPKGNHQLLSMPEGKNNMASVPIQRIHFLLAPRFDAHRPANQANHSRCHGREHRYLQPVFDARRHTGIGSALSPHTAHRGQTLLTS